MQLETLSFASTPAAAPVLSPVLVLEFRRSKLRFASAINANCRGTDEPAAPVLSPVLVLELRRSKLRFASSIKANCRRMSLSSVKGGDAFDGKGGDGDAFDGKGGDGDAFDGKGAEAVIHRTHLQPLAAQLPSCSSARWRL